MNHYDSTQANFPPMSNSPRVVQRLADGAGGAQVSLRLTPDRMYRIQTGAAAVRVEFRPDNEVAAGTVVSNTTSFRIPPNTSFPFVAMIGPDSKFGSIYVYIAGDGANAYEAFLYSASSR